MISEEVVPLYLAVFLRIVVLLRITLKLRRVPAIMPNTKLTRFVV